MKLDFSDLFQVNCPPKQISKGSLHKRNKPNVYDAVEVPCGSSPLIIFVLTG